jgi:DNA-binding MarR family transcriptional regulator
MKDHPVTGTSPHPRVTYLVKRLELAVRSRLDSVTSQHGLTTPQYAALSALRMRPGISSAALARMSFVTAQAMNEMVVVLERKELIRREVAPDHKKILQIFLTPHGSKVLAKCEAEVDDVESEMLAGLTDEEVLTMVTALRRCSEALVGA